MVNKKTSLSKQLVTTMKPVTVGGSSAKGKGGVVGIGSITMGVGRGTGSKSGGSKSSSKKAKKAY